MAKDKVIGFFMVLVAIVGIVFEAYALIIQPITNATVIGGMGVLQWWGLAAPLFLAVLGILGIILWIGVTLIITPPPETWDFEEEQEMAS